MLSHLSNNSNHLSNHHKIKKEYALKEKKQIDLISKEVLSYLEIMKYGKKSQRKVFTVLQELLTNSLKYGLNAEVKILINKKNFFLKIEDQGIGFDIEAKLKLKNSFDIDAFLNEDFNEKYSKSEQLGCGLILIKNNVDRLFYNKNGTQIMAVIKNKESDL